MFAGHWSIHLSAGHCNLLEKGRLPPDLRQHPLGVGYDFQCHVALSVSTAWFGLQRDATYFDYVNSGAIIPAMFCFIRSESSALYR